MSLVFCVVTALFLCVVGLASVFFISPVYRTYTGVLGKAGAGDLVWLASVGSICPQALNDGEEFPLSFGMIWFFVCSGFMMGAPQGSAKKGTFLDLRLMDVYISFGFPRLRGAMIPRVLVARV